MDWNNWGWWGTKTSMVSNYMQNSVKNNAHPRVAFPDDSALVINEFNNDVVESSLQNVPKRSIKNPKDSE